MTWAFTVCFRYVVAGSIVAHAKFFAPRVIDDATWAFQDRTRHASLRYYLT